jgi:hypothetical protein
MAGIDPAQSPLLDNCNLIAAITACAWTGKGAWYRNVAADQPIANSYNLQFYDYNNRNVPVVSPSKYLPQNAEGMLLYGKSTTNTECWPGIIEKGYYMARDRLRGISNDNPNMEYYNGVDINPTKDPGTVLYQLLNVEPVRRSTAINGVDYKEALVWNDMNVICTGIPPNRKALRPAIAYSFSDSRVFSPKHTYTILGQAGTYLNRAWESKYVVLRDSRNTTWEPDLKAPDVLTAGKWINNIDFAAKDGIFAIRSDLFPVYFQGYAYAVV